MRYGIVLVLISAFVVSCGHGRYKKKWQAIDTDKDGKLSQQEYMGHHSQKFKDMDANGDGSVTLEEKKAYKKKCGCKEKKHD